MRSDPDKFRYLIEALREPSRKRYGLVESRFFRWISGDMPKGLDFIVEHPELAAALLADAIRRDTERRAASGEGSPTE